VLCTNLKILEVVKLNLVYPLWAQTNSFQLLTLLT